MMRSGFFRFRYNSNNTDPEVKEISRCWNWNFNLQSIRECESNKTDPNASQECFTPIV